MNAMQPYSSMPKILVIDSNMFFVKRLTEALKEDGFEVVHCTHAAYALTMLEWNPPTAILCSTNLRELGAFELPRIVHGDAKTAIIPILAMGDGGNQALMAAVARWTNAGSLRVVVFWARGSDPAMTTPLRHARSLGLPVCAAGPAVLKSERLISCGSDNAAPMIGLCVH